MTMGMGFGAGLKALTAARLGMQTAGQNVANANTPGYSRQRVLQSSAFPFTVARGFQIGSGVEVNDIARVFDSGLERRLNLQSGMTGFAQIGYERMSEIEGMFGEPDNGLSGNISDMFTQFAGLQSDPKDRALRGGVIQSSRTMAENLNLLSSRFGEISGNTSREVGGLLRTINNGADQIAELNSQITSLESNGSSANDLRDQRGRLVAEISELIDTRPIERNTGSLDLLVGGHLIVSGDRTSPISATTDSTGSTVVQAGNSKLNVTGGKVGGLLDQENRGLPGMLSNLDDMARSFALEFNRIHSTGIPASGPFQTLTAYNGVVDADNDGQRGDELLASAGLDFDIQAGSLYVSVSDTSGTSGTPGDIERTKIDIDPRSMTLNEFATEVSKIDHLTATVDPSGRLRILAESGHGFDFSTRLDAAPDSFGSFGGQAPTLGSTSAEPYDISAAGFPQTFTVDVNGTTQTATLTAADFAIPSEVTADELAAAINDDLTNATAKNVGGRIVMRANNSGAAATMTLADTSGGPLAALGVATGPASGSDDAINIAITGEYTGSANGSLVFVPEGDGDIGSGSLTIGVFDSSGNKINTLDVGSGYIHGDQLEVADGVKVAFEHGTISATNGQVFAMDTLADSDTSDILPALGLNSFFHGSTASDLSVNEDLVDDPDLLAAGLKDFSGDGTNLQRILDLQARDLSGLNDNTIEDFYGDLVGDLGFEVATARTTLDSQDALKANLEAQRESISGVNLDEEMLDLVKYQQAFEAASRFINTVNELTDTLINLGR